MTTPRSSTATLIMALHQLARDIQSDDAGCWVQHSDALEAIAAAVAAERERCAKLVEAMDTTGHDGYIETTGDLCEAIAARIRRA